MRLIASLAVFFTATGALSQQPLVSPSALPNAPSQVLMASVNAPEEALLTAPAPLAPASLAVFSASVPAEYVLDLSAVNPEGTEEVAIGTQEPQDKVKARESDPPKHRAPRTDIDAAGNPIPLDRRQPQRILGFMPNFRSVSGGSKPPPPSWKYNFKVATRQSFDYSSFIFLGITSLSAEWINSHPVLGKGVHGFYSYTWRGFLDKTDGTYLGAWLLPSLLHEDTRYYALSKGHSVPVRILYIISRQGVARTYGGKQTPNIAGLGGKVLTQVISRYYYPPGATSFSVLATKFGYSAMRDVAFTSIREFYPDIAAHYIRKHREKVAAQAARDAAEAAKP